MSDATKAVKVVAIPGSLRAGSLNRKLLNVAVGLLRGWGAEVDLVDLKTLALPVYDGDLEEAAFPKAATELRERILRAQALVIATPEYNNSIPGALKNALDWASRPPPVNPFKGKVCAIMGATPGGFATLQAQADLRRIMGGYFGAWVVSDSVKLSRAHEAFDDAGALKDPKVHKLLEAELSTLVDAAAALVKQ